jgi:HEAT repeat protein
MPRRTEQEQTDFQNALRSVAEERDVSTAELDALSMLEGDDLERFGQQWRELSAAARARLIRKLHVAAEQRLRLDFSAINQLGVGDEDASVRLASLQCALEDRSPTWLRALLNVVREDRDVAVRLAAAEDLARFTLLAELDDLDEASTGELRSRLLESVRDEAEDARVRSAGLSALGFFSDQAIADELAAGFRSPLLRLGAIRGMGRTADPSWTDRLMPVLGSDDPQMRLEAARALGEIEDERAVGPLVEIIDDPDGAVQLAVIDALGKIGGEDAREGLLYVVEVADESVREAAEHALAALEEDEDDEGLVG